MNPRVHLRWKPPAINEFVSHSLDKVKHNAWGTGLEGLLFLFPPSLFFVFVFGLGLLFWRFEGRKFVSFLLFSFLF